MEDIASADQAELTTSCNNGEPALKHRFTPDNARLFAAMGVAERRKRRQLRLEREKELARHAKKPSEQFQDRIKGRVRIQVEKLLDSLEQEDDPVRLDKLASALSRLGELERQLDNRPLPGSMRPSPAKASKAPPIAPVD